MKKISVIIPAYNEENHIGNLLDSIEKLNYRGDFFEVVVVSDGSTDRTTQIVKSYPRVRLLDLPENVGRYECRRRGAEAAIYPNLLFIDAHSVVDPEILAVLNEIKAKVVNGRLTDVANPGAFETFYNSIRRLMFRKFYENSSQPFYITGSNFDSAVKGMGVLYIEKEVLFSAYQDLASENMNKDSSDDTKLLRAIVTREPIVNHPKVRITYFSRKSFRASVQHLFERGPKFVDYYLNPALRNFWLVIVLPWFIIVLGIAALIFLQISLLLKIALLVSLDLLAALLLARSLREFAIILYMLPLCAAVFYAGMMKGLYLKLLAKF